MRPYTPIIKRLSRSKHKYKSKTPKLIGGKWNEVINRLQEQVILLTKQRELLNKRIVKLEEQASLVGSLRDEIKQEKTLLHDERTINKKEYANQCNSLQDSVNIKIAQVQKSVVSLKTSLSDQIKSIHNEIRKSMPLIHASPRKDNARDDTVVLKAASMEDTAAEQNRIPVITTSNKTTTALEYQQEGRKDMNATLNSTSDILVSPELALKGSIFQARGTYINSECEARQFQAIVLLEKCIQEATHNVLVYRVKTSESKIIEKYNDDGEKGAGHKILKLLEKQYMQCCSSCFQMVWWNEPTRPQMATV
jgi:putative IMPACT (imprinted ancient) family translation regulator